MSNHATPAQDAQPPVPTVKQTIRELTVEQLIDRLQELPAHHHVSPMVNGVLGVGIDLWQMFDPQTNETIVVFGEPETPTPPIVPPGWSQLQPECSDTECCSACRGTGADGGGPCSDCYGTGHAHPTAGDA